MQERGSRDATDAHDEAPRLKKRVGVGGWVLVLLISLLAPAGQLGEVESLFTWPSPAFFLGFLAIAGWPFMLFASVQYVQFEDPGNVAPILRRGLFPMPPLPLGGSRHERVAWLHYAAKLMGLVTIVLLLRASWSGRGALFLAGISAILGLQQWASAWFCGRRYLPERSDESTET